VSPVYVVGKHPKLVAFSRLNCCGADPWALAAIGWSRRIHQ